MTAATKSAAVPETRLAFIVENFSVFFIALIGGLALSRILFEALFPRGLWLGRPYGAIPFALVFAYLMWGLWRGSRRLAAGPLSPLTVLPLLLNLVWLSDPTVALYSSRLVFCGTFWLLLLLAAAQLLPANHSWSILGPIFVLGALLPIYLATMSSQVGIADTFEFQVVTPQLGIVHPTGYPLYLLLGKLWTWLPGGSLAWRLNLGSAVYALTALILLFFFLFRLVGRPVTAVLGAVSTGLTVTLWSQAIVAEVYALHALIVMAALLLMREIGGWELQPAAAVPPGIDKGRLTILLAFLTGLGLANHVTTVFLLPPALLTVILTLLEGRTRPADPLRRRFGQPGFYLKVVAAFALPLFLYTYLPLRWQAVNNEPMGAARFIDWVVAGRFQGALQLRGWLDDPVRYEIVWRLFQENWGTFNLLLALAGFLFLLWRRWQAALVLFLLWLGTSFYALNYYVPDLAVFLIPAHLVVGVCWALGLAGVLWLADRAAQARAWPDLTPLLITACLVPSLLLIVAQWPRVDQSTDTGLEQWGRAVLSEPLAPDSAILADSEKIAPLSYLQIAAGLRPDLDISVWPDEAAYRAQVDGRLAAGQTVYLARQLPGLQGLYHLRAAGPLTEVSTTPVTELPAAVTPLNLSYGPIALLGYRLAPVSAVSDGSAAVTLYWQADEAVSDPFHVFIRWQGQPARDGRHPAHNFYPTNAWRPGEIVADYHLLPLPIQAQPAPLTLQVALAPPFTPASDLVWQSVTTATLPAVASIAGLRPLRAQMGGTGLNGFDMPAHARAESGLPLLLTGRGDPTGFTLAIAAAGGGNSDPPQPLQVAPVSLSDVPFALATEQAAPAENGRYHLVVSHNDTPIYCGWLRPVTTRCLFGELVISGSPLPADATNYDDQIALTSLTVANPELRPGGQLQVDIDWLALAAPAADYTIFLQVVDANDQIVGQVDSWPVQGTFPTSQWQVGERVQDAFSVQLANELDNGPYRLLVGWYLLGDGRRLPVLDATGATIDDKQVIPDLYVP